MKKTYLLWLGIFLAFNLHAQTSASDSIVRTESDSFGLPAVSATDVPVAATVWVVQQTTAMPWPALMLPVNAEPVYEMVAGQQYLLDSPSGDTGLSSDLLAKKANSISNLIVMVQAKAAASQMKAQSRSRGLAANDDGPPTPDGTGDSSDDNTNSFYPVISWDTNLLWLEITNVSGGLSYLNAHNATNEVYAIWSTTDLLDPMSWSVVTELWPAISTTNILPFTVAAGDNGIMFWRAQDWTGVETNGLPAWWLWEYFGNFNGASDSVDGLGMTLGFDYEYNFDPNIIQFNLSATNQYVNTVSPGLPVSVIAGIPGYYAVLVNDTNQTDAVWHSYTSSNLVATLGADGEYTITVGLRGLPAVATPSWQSITLIKQTIAPVLTITNPAGGTVTQPVIQIQGYANALLSSLTFDVSNAAGIFTNQTGLVTGEDYDTNLAVFSVDYFQCYDVPLTKGLNVITLHATDLTGNTTTTNLNYTLDYNAATAPELKLLWPLPNVLMGGSNFTLQATINDDTAKVTVMITDTNGNTATVPVIVERNGNIWANNLPLSAGTNTITLTATNAAGLVNTTNFAVVKSGVSLTINPIAANKTSVTVTGTVSDPAQSVWVNGALANVDESGNWIATNVPVSPTGTASLNAQAGTDTNNLTSVATLNQLQPETIGLMSYSYGFHQTFTGVGEGDGHEDYNYYWSPQSGGNEQSDYVLENQGTDHRNENSNTPLSPGQDAYSPVYEAGSVSGTYNNIINDFGNYVGSYGPYQQSASSQLMIEPSGQAGLGQTNLYLVMLSTAEYSDLSNPVFRNMGDMPRPPEWAKINGQALINTGLTNDADGAVLGAALVAGPAGANLKLKIDSTGQFQNNYYSINPLVVDLAIQSLTVISNSATQIDATNWACVKSTDTNGYVIVQAALNFTNDWVVTNAASLIQWNGGQPIPGNPLQRQVSIANSVETNITASLGSTSTNLNLWVIWATVEIKTSGNNPSPLSFADHVPPLLNTLGIVYYNNTNSARGQICVIGTVTPAGIHTLIPNGWFAPQNRILHVFSNGYPNPYAYDTTWTNDNPNPPNYTTTLDNNDKVYAIDAPNISTPNVVNSQESYLNLEDSITWKGQTCSSTNNYWHWQGRSAANQVPQVTFTDLGAGLITLPNSAFYPQQ